MYYRGETSVGASVEISNLAMKPRDITRETRKMIDTIRHTELRIHALAYDLLSLFRLKSNLEATCRLSRETSKIEKFKIRTLETSLFV